MIQQADVSVVGTEALTSVKAPRRRSYDDTALASGMPPIASDTMRWSRSSSSKPNGVAPEEATTSGSPGSPRRSTGKTSNRCVARSLTTRRSPAELKATCAGCVPGALSGRTDPASGSRSPLRTVNPAMVPASPAFST